MIQFNKSYFFTIEHHFTNKITWKQPFNLLLTRRDDPWRSRVCSEQWKDSCCWVSGGGNWGKIWSPNAIAMTIIMITNIDGRIMITHWVPMMITMITSMLTIYIYQVSTTSGSGNFVESAAFPPSLYDRVQVGVIIPKSSWPLYVRVQVVMAHKPNSK